MKELEARIAQLESEMQRCIRQNRRMKALAFPVLVLAALPFLLAWGRSSEATFDAVTAETFYVKRDGKVLASLTGGALKLFSAEAGLVAELGKLDHVQAGVLKLTGPKKPRFHSHIEMGVNTFGVPRLAFYGEPQSSTASFSVQVNSPGNASMHFSNPPGTNLISMGSDGKGDAIFFMSDSKGKPTVRLDALPKSIGFAGAAGAAQRGLPGRNLPGRNLTSTGGGGQITLSNPSGATTFRAPLEPAANVAKPPG